MTERQRDRATERQSDSPTARQKRKRKRETHTIEMCNFDTPSSHVRIFERMRDEPQRRGS